MDRSLSEHAPQGVAQPILVEGLADHGGAREMRCDAALVDARDEHERDTPAFKRGGNRIGGAVAIQMDIENGAVEWLGLGDAKRRLQVIDRAYHGVAYAADDSFEVKSNQALVLENQNSQPSICFGRHWVHNSTLAIGGHSTNDATCTVVPGVRLYPGTVMRKLVPALDSCSISSLAPIC